MHPEGQDLPLLPVRIVLIRRIFFKNDALFRDNGRFQNVPNRQVTHVFRPPRWSRQWPEVPAWTRHLAERCYPLASAPLLERPLSLHAAFWRGLPLRLEQPQQYRPRPT